MRELLLKGCIKEDKIAFARTLLIAADTSCTIEELDETTDLDSTLAAADVSHCFCSEVNYLNDLL